MQWSYDYYWKRVAKPEYMDMIEQKIRLYTIRELLFFIITTNPYHGRFRMTSLGGCRPRMSHPPLRCSRCPDPQRIRGSPSVLPTPDPSLRDPSRPIAKKHSDRARPAPKSC